MTTTRFRFSRRLLCAALLALPSTAQVDLGPANGAYGETDWGDFDNDGQEDVVLHEGAGFTVVLGAGLLGQALDEHVACTDVAVARRDGGESLLLVDALGLHELRWNALATASPYFTTTLLEAGPWADARHVAVGRAANGDAVVFGIGSDGSSLLRAVYMPGVLNLAGSLGTTTVVSTASGPYTDLLAANVRGSVVDDAVLVSDDTIEVRDGSTAALVVDVYSSVFRNDAVAVVRCQFMDEALAVVSSVTAAPAVQVFTVIRVDATGSAPLVVYSSQQVLGSGLAIHGLAAGDFLPSKDFLQTSSSPLVMDELALATSNSADLSVVTGNRIDGELVFDVGASSTLVLSSQAAASGDPVVPLFVDVDHDGDEDLFQVLASEDEAVTHENGFVDADTMRAELLLGAVGDVCGEKAVVARVDTLAPPAGAEFLEVAWWFQPSPTAPMQTSTSSFFRYSVAASPSGYVLHDGFGVPAASAVEDQFDGLYFLVLQYVAFATPAEPYRYPPAIYVVHASAEGSAVRNYYKELSIGGGLQEKPFRLSPDMTTFGAPDPCPASILGSSWHMAQAPTVPTTPHGVTVVGGGSQTPKVPGGSQPVNRP